MRLFLILSACLVGLSAAQKPNQKHFWCKLGNATNPTCVAEPERYKCAMAFKNLNYGDNTRLSKVKSIDIEGDGYTFFAGVPDVLIEAKASGNTRRYLKLVKSLGNTYEDAYILDVLGEPASEVCQDDELAQRTANSRCVAQFWKAAQNTKLDTCDTNALNDASNGRWTIGENLCRRSSKLSGGAKQDNVELQIIVSACGKPWRLVKTGKEEKENLKAFQVKEKLCCEMDPEGTGEDKDDTNFYNCGESASTTLEEKKAITNTDKYRCQVGKKTTKTEAITT